MVEDVVELLFETLDASFDLGHWFPWSDPTEVGAETAQGGRCREDADSFLDLRGQLRDSEVLEDQRVVCHVQEDLSFVVTFHYCIYVCGLCVVEVDARLFADTPLGSLLLWKLWRDLLLEERWATEVSTHRTQCMAQKPEVASDEGASPCVSRWVRNVKRSHKAPRSHEDRAGCPCRAIVGAFPVLPRKKLYETCRLFAVDVWIVVGRCHGKRWGAYPP